MSTSTHLEVSLDRQTLDLSINGNLVRTFSISTSEKGMGFEEGSLRTPTGRFRISEKIGADEPIFTRFVARTPVGIWDSSETSDDDLILTRILRLEGLDPENANTWDRYIYIHGTNREDQLGTPCEPWLRSFVQSRHAGIVRCSESWHGNDYLASDWLG